MARTPTDRRRRTSPASTAETQAAAPSIPAPDRPAVGEDGDDGHLQNRVDPLGALFRSAARGLFMGNRGGRIHDPGTRELVPARRWVSKAWICCEIAFRERSRTVWGESYTELFFLDEVTALAAGHRPCFECRRQAAQDFAAAFAHGNGLAAPPAAGHMDAILHQERVGAESGDRREKRLYVAFIDTLPDGAAIASDGPDRQIFAVRGPYMLPWGPHGWGPPLPRPKSRLVTLVTPPSTVMALKAGYRPVWHPSAATEAFDRRHPGSAAA